MAEISNDEEEKRKHNDGMLLQAIWHHSHDLAEAYLKKGADPNMRSDGGTIFIWAIKGNDTALIELLLQSGRVLDIPDDYGRYPMDYVSDIKGKDVMQGGSLEILLRQWGISKRQAPKNKWMQMLARKRRL